MRKIEIVGLVVACIVVMWGLIVCHSGCNKLIKDQKQCRVICAPYVVEACDAEHNVVICNTAKKIQSFDGR